MTDGYDQFGLPLRTDFIDNGIGVDPARCGCTDCLLGHSIPEDNKGLMNSLAAAIAMNGRRVFNRSGSEFVLVQQADGKFEFIEPGKEMRVLGYLKAD